MDAREVVPASDVPKQHDLMHFHAGGPIETILLADATSIDSSLPTSLDAVLCKIKRSPLPSVCAHVKSITIDWTSYRV